MVHADASNFPAGITKADAYTKVLEEATALFEGQTNWICNLSNTASLLWHAFHSIPGPTQSVNWSGFYVLDPAVSEQLILGPFMGKVACQTIKFTRGICGRATRTGETQVVPACDSDTRSEIVVPVWSGGKVVAVIDVDSTAPATFDDADKKGLEELAKLLGTACKW